MVLAFVNTFKWQVNHWLFALARRIETLVHIEEKQPLSDPLRESKSIIERLPATTLDVGMNPVFLTYVNADLGPIRSHSLHHTIRETIRKQSGPKQLQGLRRLTINATLKARLRTWRELSSKV